MCLVRWWSFRGAPLAYLAAASAMALGLLLILRPELLGGRSLGRAAADALVLGVLLAATGGAGSPFFPLYLFAALSVAGLVSRAGDKAPLLPAAGATAALIGGYLLAATLVGGRAALGSPPFFLNSGVLVLFCAAVFYLGLGAREAEERAEKAEVVAAIERTRGERTDELTGVFMPALGVLNVGAALGVIAEAAKAITGGSYSHVAAIGGDTHRTVMDGDNDACPSWWHPTVQRLQLWSCREGNIARDEETVHGLKGLVAVPVGPSDGGGMWGTIIVGGGSVGAEEERALQRLAEAALPVLARRPDAAGGLDPASGLPNAASLVRVLRAELSAGRAPGILAADLGWARGTGAGEDPLRRLGGRLEGAGQRAFRYGEDLLIVLVEDGERPEAARKAGALSRMLREEASALSGARTEPAVGFGRARARGQTPEELVGVALRALEEARPREEEAAGVPAGRRRPAEMPTPDAPSVQGLMRAMAARDPYLLAHSVRVSRIAGRIGRVLSFSEAEIGVLEVGALLHDVGKIGIPDRILRKPGPLTDEEYAMVKVHPALGSKILAPFPELAPVLSAVHHHHERFDGLGYPDNLRGEDIPILARVICVADAFDSMTKQRPYGRHVSTEKARQEIRRNAGTQFDPQVTGALSRVEPGRDGPLAGFAG